MSKTLPSTGVPGLYGGADGREYYTIDYVYVIEDGVEKRKQQRVPLGHDRAEAIRKLAERKAAPIAVERAKVLNDSLETAFENACAKKVLESTARLERVKDTSVTKYRSVWRVHIRPYFESIGRPTHRIRVSDVEEAHVEGLMEYVRTRTKPDGSPYSESTVGGVWTALSTTLTFAGVRTNACRTMARSKKPDTTNPDLRERPSRHMTPEEIALVRKAITTTSTGRGRYPRVLYGAMIDLCTLTGHRISELLAWRWDEIDWTPDEKGMCKTYCQWQKEPRGQETADLKSTLRSRTTKKRWIPLVPEAVALLKEHRAWLTTQGTYVLDGSGYVFPMEDGKMYGYDNVQKRLQKAAEKAGVERVGWHNFRHTCASNLWAIGVGIEEIAAGLGDTAETIRNSYLTETEEKVERTVAAWSLAA